MTSQKQNALPIPGYQATRDKELQINIESFLPFLSDDRLVTLYNHSSAVAQEFPDTAVGYEK